MIIYQMLMMLWEAILENRLLVAILITVLVAPWLYWFINGRKKSFNHQRSLIVALVVSVTGFFFLPLYFRSSANFNRRKGLNHAVLFNFLIIKRETVH